MAASKYKMSEERLQSLKEELAYLETTRATEIAEQIKEARSFGDLSENSEYDEAKAEQGRLYNKISEIKDLIENAEIVEAAEGNAPKGSVTLGSIVELLDKEFNEKLTYEIVGSQEANPMGGRISDDSPLGKGLHGHKAGDIVTIDAPAGTLSFEILSVKND